MTYGKHPSISLRKLYEINSHQGASPTDAKILFLGRDANWKEEIEKEKFFSHIAEYLENGVDYWNKYGVHHPFLQKEYKGDGQRYHRMFSKLNLDKSKAKHLSFIELLSFPTYGMAKKIVQEFSLIR